MTPQISVIVPTYNRLPRLQQVLAALEAQHFPHEQFEVIVVSDGSSDGTNEYLRSHRSTLRLRPVLQANAGPAAARNTGFQSAHSEYVLFIDDDVVPSPQLVAEHVYLQHKRENLIVLGPMLTPPDFTLKPWVAWEQAMLEKQYTAMQAGVWPATARQFYTGNTSLRRELLLQAGGFDERFRRAEDIELAYRLERLGVEFVFSMAPEAHHYAERSYAAWLQIPYAYGRYDIVFSREQKPQLQAFVRKGFYERNRLTQAIVRLCLDRPLLSRAMQAGAKTIADGTARLKQHRLTIAAYSAIFNLRYYQGVADEQGGRAAFFAPAPPAIAEQRLPS